MFVGFRRPSPQDISILVSFDTIGEEERQQITFLFPPGPFCTFCILPLALETWKDLTCAGLIDGG